MIPLGQAFAVPAVHAGVIIVGWVIVHPIPDVIGWPLIFLGLTAGTLVTAGLAKQLSGPQVGEPFVAFASLGMVFGVVALYFTLLLGFAYDTGSGRTDWIETQRKFTRVP